MSRPWRLGLGADARDAAAARCRGPAAGGRAEEVVRIARAALHCTLHYMDVQAALLRWTLAVDQLRVDAVRAQLLHSRLGAAAYRRAGAHSEVAAREAARLVALLELQARGSAFVALRRRTRERSKGEAEEECGEQSGRRQSGA